MSVTIAQAILLGIVQGLTEFLPISSTAHLALVQAWLPGFSQPGILFDVMLHVGTLFAVSVYFRKRIADTFRALGSADAEEKRAAWRLAGFLFLAVALTGAIALPLRGLVVEGMTDFTRIGLALLATAVLLSVAQAVGKARGEGGRALSGMRPRDAALIGICQSLSAVLHGLSRSGNTISVGLFSGLSRRAAAEFSFLLSIPTILAAALTESWSAYRHGGGGGALAAGVIPAYVVGVLVSAVVGYLSIAVLLRLVIDMKLLPFAAYCAVLGGFLVFRSF
jgi:undecaprenyl-diphosphatase